MWRRAQQVGFETRPEAVVYSQRDDQGHHAGSDAQYGDDGDQRDYGLATLGFEIACGDEELESL